MAQRLQVIAVIKQPSYAAVWSDVIDIRRPRSHSLFCTFGAVRLYQQLPFPQFLPPSRKVQSVPLSRLPARCFCWLVRCAVRFPRQLRTSRMRTWSQWQICHTFLTPPRMPRAQPVTRSGSLAQAVFVFPLRLRNPHRFQIRCSAALS